jgi:hypothetical protein
MNFGDLTWGMIVGYILLGGIWLSAERIITGRSASGAEQRSLRRANSAAKRSTKHLSQDNVPPRMSVVRSLDVARRRKQEVPPLRMGTGDK